MKKFPIYALLVTLCIGCSKDTSKPLDPTQIDLVTGFCYKSDPYSQTKVLGNPNTKRMHPIEVDVLGKKIMWPAISILPNPGNGMYWIRSHELMQKIWIVKGKKSMQLKEVEFNNILLDHTYSESVLNSEAIASFKVEDIPANPRSVNLDITHLSEGYYRIFLLSEENNLYWDNLYIFPSEATSFKDLDDAFKKSWEYPLNED